MKVLYIEDNPANLRFMQKALELRGGIELLCVESGYAGIEVARLEQPAFILLDIQLPEIDGYEVFARLQSRETTRNIPVIAVSANAMQGDIQRALEQGFRGYITKPIDLKILYHKIDEVMGL